jgi:DNA-binding NarL/FixJ family response regulator
VDVRLALRLLLEQRLDFQVVGEATHAYGLVSLVNSAHADLVLIDWEIPGRIDARLITGLRQLVRRPRVIIMSSYPDVEGAALVAGADAFISKGSPPDQFMALLAASPAR